MILFPWRPGIPALFCTWEMLLLPWLSGRAYARLGAAVCTPQFTAGCFYCRKWSGGRIRSEPTSWKQGPRERPYCPSCFCGTACCPNLSWSCDQMVVQVLPGVTTSLEASLSRERCKGSGKDSLTQLTVCRGLQPIDSRMQSAAVYLQSMVTNLFNGVWSYGILSSLFLSIRTCPT